MNIYLQIIKLKYIKKRIVVENSHAWREFIIPRLGKVYDKNIDNIYGQLYLSTIYLIFNRNLI